MSIRENDRDGAFLYKNDDKLSACTVDIVVNVCLLKLLSLSLMMMSILMGWTAPTFFNEAAATIEVRAQMLLLLLLLLQSLRDAFHPSVRRRLALGCEKARLCRLFIPRGKSLSVQPERPDMTRANKTAPHALSRERTHSKHDELLGAFPLDACHHPANLIGALLAARGARR